jgi:uncharacterized protein
MGQIGRFLSLVLANRWNALLLDQSPSLGLEDWWLTAGCIAQSVWNGLYGRPPAHVDYDIFYFDPDTSWAAEDRVIAKAAALFASLPVTVQIRNQARVPLWYESKFGVPFPPLAKASDGIDRFPCATVAIGICRNADGLAIHAPFGLDLVLRGELTPNTYLQIPEIYAAKTARWIQTWPELAVTPWPESGTEL